MTQRFTDRLTAAIADKGSPVCVGLDPAAGRLPEGLTQDDPPLTAVRRFCMGIIDAVTPYVPAVKPQIAYFERLGGAGVDLYFETVAYARTRGLIVIGDVKRGDIGSTAKAYAAAHLLGEDRPDAITVNGYFGEDGLAPFIQAAKDTGRGLFVLVRTSNPSGAVVQDFSSPDGTKLYQHIAKEVARLGEDCELVGECGYSGLGAVVGATWPAEVAELRAIMAQQWFLVPGYGAQGASARECAMAFGPDGRGAIVNASRSVIYAYEKRPDRDWQEAIALAAQGFAGDIAAAVRS